MATPIKFLRASIDGVSVKSTATIGGVAGVPYQWNATLTVVAQAHSDPTSTPVANYYIGRNVVVGDWITSDASGKALKIASIASQTDTSVVCVLEDVDNSNALSDETGNLDGMIPNGAGIGAYIFSVKNNVPILGNIPASLPGNLAGSDFVNNIQSRFASTATVGISETTGKLDASILPTPVVGGAPGAVGVTADGPFALDANGNLTLKAGIASLDANGLIPSSQLPSFVDDVLEFANLAGFPTSGDAGKIYVAIDTGKVYRWSGSTYIEISSAGVADTAPLASPALTGTPTAPTAPAGTNSTQLATTAFVATAVGNVVSTAPTGLNTMAKISTALNNDPNAYTTLTSLMDSKIATAVAGLSGGASASLNTFAEVETALANETAAREAADTAMQATIDALSMTDIDGGEF